MKSSVDCEFTAFTASSQSHPKDRNRRHYCMQDYHSTKSSSSTILTVVHLQLGFLDCAPDPDDDELLLNQTISGPLCDASHR